MPAIVKTERDERLWKAAKRQTEKQYPHIKKGGSRYWSIVNRIFHRMKHRVGGGPLENFARLPGGVAEGMRPDVFDRYALRKGTAVEMEHTDDPEIAQEIAMDHLAEDPNYYEKLALIHNPPRPSIKIRDAYIKFHGVEPSTMEERAGLWIPGPMVYLGPCVDIGYKPPKGSSKGQYNYVHDHKEGVKVYCRPDQAPDDTDPSIFYRRFPSELWALGVNIGFTYKDRFDGEEYEVTSSAKMMLYSDSSRKKLYVLDKKGVLFLVKGGKLIVTDWIRN